MTTIIQCSGCQRRLKVPEGVLGKTVKCPACGAQFTAVAEEVAAPPPLPPDNEGIQPEAPPPTAAKSSSPPPSRAERNPLDDDDDDSGPSRRGRRSDDENDDFDDEDDRPRRRRIALSKPVTSLVLPPAICLAVTGFLGIVVNGLRIVVALGFPDALQNNPFGIAVPPWVEVLFGAVFILFAMGTIAGSIAMMKTRYYVLSIAGAIMAMLDLTFCCCLLGLPLGIWAIIVLSRPEVKDAFSR